MNRANLKLQHSYSDRKNDCGNRNRKTLAARVEILLCLRKQEAHYRTKDERRHYFDNRIENDRINIYISAYHSLCYTKGNRKNYESYRIVKSYDGKKDISKLTLCLILANDHESCRRSGCRSYCSERDSHADGKLILTKNKAKHDKRNINQNRSGYSLKNSDYGCLFTNLFELRKSELISDRESDKAESNIGNNTEVLNVFKRAESKSRNAQSVSEQAKAKRSDKNACDKVSRNCGKAKGLNDSRHQKSRQKRDSDTE